MNAELLERARAAYRAGVFSTAAQMFSACKENSEVAGEVDHLRGNSLMKLGLAREAASAYALALNDAAYGKRGALLTNVARLFLPLAITRALSGASLRRSRTAPMPPRTKRSSALAGRSLPWTALPRRARRFARRRSTVQTLRPRLPLPSLATAS